MIVLVGFMGAGKTTVGHMLAEKLGLPFVDSDLIIESRTGRSIREIFVADGEPAFRGDAQGPGDPAVGDVRDARRVPDERSQRGRRLLTTDDRLKRGPDLEDIPQFLVGADTPGAGQPGAGPGRVGEVVGRHAVDHGRAVEEGQQEVLVRHGLRHRLP